MSPTLWINVLSFPVTIVPKSNLHPVWCVCTIKHLLPLPNVVCMPLHVTHTVDKSVKFSSHYSAQIKSSPSVVCVYHQAPAPFAQCCVYATPCHPHWSCSAILFKQATSVPSPWQGFLNKQGHGAIKRWEKRYVALKGAKLAYYHSKEVRGKWVYCTHSQSPLMKP